MTFAYSLIKYEDEDSYQLLFDSNLMSEKDNFIADYCWLKKDGNYYFSNNHLSEAILYIESKLYEYDSKIFVTSRTLYDVNNKIDTLENTLNSVLEQLEEMRSLDRD